jgi:hypothetical protein
VIDREEFVRKALEELRKADRKLHEKLREAVEREDAWAREVLETAYRLNLLLGFSHACEKLKKLVEVA